MPIIWDIVGELYYYTVGEHLIVRYVLFIVFCRATVVMDCSRSIVGDPHIIHHVTV